MVTVEFLGPIGKTPQTFDVKSLQELSNILKQDENVSKWLDICAVAINDKIADSKDIELKSGDKVTLLPPVCGG